MHSSEATFVLHKLRDLHQPRQTFLGQFVLNASTAVTYCNFLLRKDQVSIIFKNDKHIYSEVKVADWKSPPNFRTTVQISPKKFKERLLQIVLKKNVLVIYDRWIVASVQ